MTNLSQYNSFIYLLKDGVIPLKRVEFHAYYLEGILTPRNCSYSSTKDRTSSKYYANGKAIPINSSDLFKLKGKALSVILRNGQKIIKYLIDFYDRGYFKIQKSN